MSGGWVKIHRSIRNDILWEDPQLFKAWVDLILMASHCESKSVSGMSIVEVERGQVLTSLSKLAVRWGWGVQKVRNYLLLLEDDSKITRQTTSQYTLITLVNYDKWQAQETDETTIKEHAKNTRRTHIKNGKNNNNTYTPQFEDFWKGYPRQIGKTLTFKNWNTRLKEGHLPESLVLAAKNYALSINGNEPQFIKHPSTFLGPNMPFEDYIQWAGDKPMPIGGRSVGTLTDCSCRECTGELERRKGERT